MPVLAPTTSHSVNSPLSPSITLSFTSGSRPISFTNISHHGLPSSLRTDSTDFKTGPFLISRSVFERPFVKRFALCYVTVVHVCPVCDVGVLWPNGWPDQDETWRAGRPRPWPHCVRWEPSSPSPKGAQRPSKFRPISVAAKWLH